MRYLVVLSCKYCYNTSIYDDEMIFYHACCLGVKTVL